MAVKSLELTQILSAPNRIFSCKATSVNLKAVLDYYNNSFYYWKPQLHMNEVG